MTFLVLNMATTQLIIQQSDLEYQEMILSQEYDQITQEIGDRSQELSSTTTSGTSNTNTLENDSELQYLKAQQDIYDTKKSNIESQLKVIQAELENYQKAVDTNVKSECKLNIST